MAKLYGKGGSIVFNANGTADINLWPNDLLDGLVENDQLKKAMPDDKWQWSETDEEALDDIKANKETFPKIIESDVGTHHISAVSSMAFVPKGSHWESISPVTPSGPKHVHKYQDWHNANEYTYVVPKPYVAPKPPEPVITVETPVQPKFQYRRDGD